MTTFIFHLEIKAKTCFLNLRLTSFHRVLLFRVNSKCCKDVFKDRQLQLGRNECQLHASHMLIYSTVKVQFKARMSQKEPGGLMVCSKKGLETIKCNQDFSLEMS